MTKAYTKADQEALKFAHTFYTWWKENQEEILNRNAELDAFIAKKWPFDTIEKEVNFPFILACLLTTAAKVFVSMNTPKGAPRIIMQSIFEGYKDQVVKYVESKMKRKEHN